MNKLFLNCADVPYQTSKLSAAKQHNNKLLLIRIHFFEILHIFCWKEQVGGRRRLLVIVEL